MIKKELPLLENIAAHLVLGSWFLKMDTMSVWGAQVQERNPTSATLWKFYLFCS